MSIDVKIKPTSFLQTQILNPVLDTFQNLQLSFLF